MTFFSMTKFLVFMFCSLLSKTVNAGGPYTCPYSVLGAFGYDFSVTTVGNSTVETCPWPQFPNQTYYGGGDENGEFFHACMVWAGSFSNTDEVKTKKTGCTFYKEGLYNGPSQQYECCKLADCNSACVRHIVMCCVH